MREERELKRGFQIYIKDIRSAVFNKIAAGIILSAIVGTLAVRMIFPFILNEDAGTELIISSFFKLMIIYYAVICFGSDYFTNTARLIYSVQEKRLVIYAFKLLSNMTIALYLAILHILLKVIMPNLAGDFTYIGEVLTIPLVYLCFSTAVTVFSIALSLIVKSSATILIVDYFLFFWTIGDYLVIFGQKLSNVFFRLIFIHNTFYELGRSFTVMQIDLLTLKSSVLFILFFGIIGAIMLKRKDIS